MLLDTSGLLCYHDRDQTEHAQAQNLLEQPGRKIVHNYVLVEFVALAQARKLSRKPALDFLGSLLNNPLVETVWVDERLHREGMELLRSRPVRIWLSVVRMTESACVSVMRTRQASARLMGTFAYFCIRIVPSGLQ